MNMSTAEKKVFILTYGGGHVNIMIPVIRELQKNDAISLSVLGLSIASKRLKEEGIPHHTISYYKELIMDESAWSWGKKLAGEYHVESSGITYEETIIYFGASMRDLVSKQGLEEAVSIFELQGRACFLPTYTMEKILAIERPDLLLTGNCPRMEHAAMRVAYGNGIKVLSLNDLLGFDKKYIFPADKIAVISEITRENLIKDGNDENKIVVTGSPSLDGISDEMRSFSRTKICEALGMPMKAKAFLLATQPQKICTWEMIDMMTAVLDAYPDHYLVIKHHPGDDRHLYVDYLANKNHPRVILADMDVRKIIFVSDITITIFSTVGLESILMGVPLVQLNLLGIPNPIPLFKYNVCLEATSFPELVDNIGRLLGDKILRRELSRNKKRYFNSILNGSGLKNCIKLVYELLGMENELKEKTIPCSEQVS